jgi:hypothetical protein
MPKKLISGTRHIFVVPSVEKYLTEYNERYSVSEQIVREKGVFSCNKYRKTHFTILG